MNNEIQILSKYLNYVDSKKALTTLKRLNEEEKDIVLKDESVKRTILKIKDTNILRDVFRFLPDWFQEELFEDVNVQNVLIQLRPSLDAEKMEREYNKTDITFRDEELRKLEVFLHTIKSQKVRDKLIENKFFQMVIPLCFETQLSKSFFENLDKEKLFENITTNDFIFKTTRAPRKRNVLKIFNKVSSHVLLVEGYGSILKGDEGNILNKKRYMEEERIFIDRETFKMLTPELANKLLEFDNIDRKFIESVIRENVIELVSKDGFVVKDLLDKNNHDIIRWIRGIEFYNITIASDLLKDDPEKKQEFIDLLFKYTGDYSNLSIEKIEILKNAFFDRINSRHINIKDFNNLYCNSSANKTVFYLKFNKTSRRMDYINSIGEDQLMKVNVKHINQIVKLMETENEDEISLIYSNAIKMYFVFGLERSIRMLKGEYGPLDTTFYDNLGKIDIKNIKLKQEGSKFIPVISTDFINFMFATEKRNHFIDMLEQKGSLINKYWYYVYNNFSSIKERCHSNITMKRVNTILEQFSPEKDISDVSVDNYKLEEQGILNDMCLGNKTKHPNEYVYKSLLDIYEKMKYRNESSIPYVKGECENGYSYEMMRLNDPIAFTLGYKANCCIRVEDIAHRHLLHATLCRNGRILIIYDQTGEVAGFAPLKRNGEVLIANSIECAHKKKNDKAIEAFEQAISHIVKESKGEEPIGLVCIGSEAYAKPKGSEFPREIKTPTIYEKDDPVYGNTDSYHRKLDVIYKDSKTSLKHIKYGNPKVSYKDPRKAPVDLEFNYYDKKKEIEQAVKAINGIRYAKIKNDFDKVDSFKKINSYGIRRAIYSDDWFVLLLNDGKVFGEYLSYDDRAENEYRTVYRKVCEEANKQIKRTV